MDTQNLKGQSNNYGCKIQYFITLEGNTCCRFLGVATYVESECESVTTIANGELVAVCLIL